MRRAPVLLAFDTSTVTAVVAVGRGARTLAVRHEPAPRAYDEGLLPRIASALHEASVEPRELDAVACGRGPGSFTGLRIALATAKGFAFALDVPLLLVSSTAATALGAGDAASVVVVLDAKRGQLYAQTFRLAPAARGQGRLRRPLEAGGEIVEPHGLVAWIASRGLPSPIALVGDGLPAALEGTGSLPGGMSARDIAHPPGACLYELARRELAARRFAPLDAAEPDYIRPPPFHPPSARTRGALGSRSPMR